MSARDRTPSNPRSKLQPEAIVPFLLYQLDATHGGDPRENRLPQGALATDRHIYYVSGREEGSGEKQRLSTPSFMSGNPLDIMGHFMLDGEFFAFDNMGYSKTHWHQHRHLEPVEEGREYRFRMAEGFTNFVCRDGLLVPVPAAIEPIAPLRLEFLSPLKERAGFYHAASNLLGRERAADLANHLF